MMADKSLLTDEDYVPEIELPSDLEESSCVLRSLQKGKSSKSLGHLKKITGSGAVEDRGEEVVERDKRNPPAEDRPGDGRDDITDDGGVLDGRSGPSGLASDAGGVSGDSTPKGDSRLEGDQVSLLIAAINASKRSMMSSMRQELSQFKDEMKGAQEDAADSVVKKVKRAKQHVFNKRGNEKQFLFNEEVDEKLEVVEAELEKIAHKDSSSRSKATLEKAKSSLQEGRDLIASRQKLIRLADRSEFGWDLVKEYQADELADDSDDAKKIAKVEKAAEKKVTKRKRTASQSSLAKRKNFMVQRANRGGAQPTHSWEPSSTSGASPKVATKVASSARVGPCFSCFVQRVWTPSKFMP